MNKAFLTLLLWSVFQSSNVFAGIEIKGTVKSGDIQWDNVTYSESRLAPSTWSTPPLLQASDAWVPGTFASSPAKSVTFFGGTGEVTAPVSIDIAGMQYNTAGMSFAISSSSIASGCTVDKINLPVATVEGASCISSYKLVNAKKTQPFVFYRPLFNVDTASLTSALSGRSEGVYSASVPVVIRYYYENNGIMTYRNINETVIFVIDYQPVQLDNVTVIGDGTMVPNYDTTNTRVTSDTRFDITATGYFNNGLALTLSNPDYELVNSTDPSITIPYTINCPQCSELELVRDGVLMNEKTDIARGIGVQTSINFNLDFSYDVDGRNIVSGDYSDSVTIILEPGI
ncbi:hypothetical protein F0231_09510 [Vibrio sp. RE86]|uniref:hypothetical protein n=1 Tax=Vibrio sp. RE86 TaxID=2607605 RepID=UPI001493BA54|nr:hypothetical protein [Vibrio sp. RE86]NOH79977.1 hypothetical protein [Vibrio sp. RE86]